MSHHPSYRIIRSILYVGLLCGLIVWGGQAATPVPAVDLQPDNPLFTPKIEPLLLEGIASSGQMNYLVWLTDQADLSPASVQQTKAEKGRFVFEALRTEAKRSQKDLQAFLEQRGIGFQPYYIVNAILVRQGDRALLQVLAARPDVARITASRNYRMPEELLGRKATDEPSTVEPNLAFIHADDVWAMGFTGQGVVLGNLGTGLDETHPAIARHYRGCQDPPACTTWDHNYNWWDATGEYPDNPTDGNGHGTFMTGVMVGDDGGNNQIGVAPGARTIACKALDDWGGATTEDLLECLEWALAPWDLNGQNPDPAMAPDAYNNPWGYWGGGDEIFRVAIGNLQAAGVMVIFAIGSEGPGCGTVRSPADYAEVLTIGCTDGTGGDLPGVLCQFTARGPSILDPWAYFPDVIAPGIDIRSSLPGGGYAVWSGTSSATSHTPGLAALCWSANPALRGDIIATTDIIYAGAVPLTGQYGSNCGGNYIDGPNNDWGYGSIDALTTVMACLSGAGNGFIQGKVTDGLSDLPIESAAIAASGGDGSEWSTGTDPSGYYSMTVPTGIYTVTASHPAYITMTMSGVEVITGTTTTQDFALLPAVSFSPTPLETTLDWLATGSVQVTLTNRLDVPYSFEFLELPGGAALVDEVPWFGQAPVSGTAPPSSTLTANMLFTATIEAGISQPGYYTATLVVMGAPMLNVPVSLQVVGQVITPTASFSATTPACLGETMTFTNTTIAGVPPETTFEWNFGDGSTSGEENPAHLYALPGDYPVELRACNYAGCDTYSLPVEVLPLPKASFTYTVEGLVVNFTNTSVNAEAYSWEFGDGGTSNEENPSRAYPQTGEYLVKLAVTGSCGLDTSIAYIEVRAFRLALPIISKTGTR